MARTTINTQVIPDGTIVSADLSYPLTDFSSTGIDDNATTTAITIDSSQDVTFTSDAFFPDSGKAIFGASSDLQIYHDGSNSYVQDAGAGDLRIKGANVEIQTGGGNKYFQGAANIARLYHTNNERLATTSTGIDVTGNVNSDSVTTGTFTSTGIDDNATSTAITIDSSENVGIGTASPDETLVVDGGAKILGTNKLSFTNTSDQTYIQAASSNVLAFGTDSTERMRIDSSGIVTINESAGSSDNTILRIKGGTAGYSSLQLGDADDINVGMIQYNHSSNSLAFNANDAERMRIDSSGNLGIGSSDPSSPLSIARSNSSTTIGGSDCVIKVRNNSGTIGSTSGLEFLHGSVETNVQRLAGVYGVYDSFDASGFGGELVFATNTAGDTTIDERMRIDSSGNVGIGTTSPDALLHLESSTNAQIRFSDADDPLNNFVGLLTGSDTLYIACDEDSASSNSRIGFRIDGTERMRIDTGGNVGIGTTSPDSILHLSGSSASKIIIEDSANPRGNYIGINSSDNLVIAADEDNLGSSSTIQFRVDATERMRIDSSGNVGIGTTSPSSILTVNKDTGSTPTVYINNSGPNITEGVALKVQASGRGTGVADASIFSVHNNTTELFTVRNDGRVGIGTSSPVRPLHIHQASNSQMQFTDDTSGSANTDGLRVGWNGTEGQLYLFENAALRFATNDSERMRIDSSGNVLVGTTSQSGTAILTVNGTNANRAGIYVNGYSNNEMAVFDSQYDQGSSGGVVFKRSGNFKGNITWTSVQVSYNTSSDQRLKENIVDAPAGNIDAIRVRSFDWKADGSHQTYGMVAQELVDVAPEAVVQGETEDDMWAVDYSKLVPMMIKEIQDLKAEVAALRGV